MEVGTLHESGQKVDGLEPALFCLKNVERCFGISARHSRDAGQKLRWPRGLSAVGSRDLHMVPSDGIQYSWYKTVCSVGRVHLGVAVCTLKYRAPQISQQSRVPQRSYPFLQLFKRKNL